MKNKLLLTIDGIRKDHLGCYNPKAARISPRITEIAERSVVFDDMMAAATSTAMCFSSIFTGELSATFGRLDYGDSQNPHADTLFSDHEALGYTTFVSVNRRFEEYIEMMNAFSRAEFLWTGERPVNGSANAKGEASLRPMEQAKFLTGHLESSPAPWLAWIHLWGFGDPDAPYVRRTGFDYDSRLAELDDAVGFLFDRFHGGSDVFVFADHGYAFFEHGRWAYGIDGHNLVEPVVSVPFLVHDGATRGRNPNLVSQLRVREIVREPAIALELHDKTAVCESRYAGQIDKGLVLRKGDYKLIYFHENGRREFYDLATDPRETIDYAGNRFHRHRRDSGRKPRAPYVVRSDWDALEATMEELTERARNFYPRVSVPMKTRAKYTAKKLKRKIPFLS
jgi:arylsulfatase A-like enzyme